MMADFRLFVTAPNADFKTVNELLVYLRDWEDGSGDTFHLETGRIIEDRVKKSKKLVKNPIAVPGEMTASTYQNAAWAGASIKDVEAFAAQELHSISSPKAHVSFFVVLDEQGVGDHTVLCVEKVEPAASEEGTDDGNDDEADNNNDDETEQDSEPDKESESENEAEQDNESDEAESPNPQDKQRKDKDLGDGPVRFNKVRLPWYGAYPFCANMGEANLGFEEYCNEEVGPDDQLYWAPNEDLLADDANGEDALERRTKFLEKLRKENLI